MEFLASINIFEALMQVSIVLVGLASGGTFVVPTITWLKNRFGTDGGQTLFLVGLFATLLTVATAVVEGQLAPGTVTPQTWGAMLLAIMYQANTRYLQIKRDLEGK